MSIGPIHLLIKFVIWYYIKFSFTRQLNLSINYLFKIVLGPRNFRC